MAIESAHDESQNRPPREFVPRRKKSAWRGFKNRFLHTLCRVAPIGSAIRVLLHRWRGVGIGEGVFIGEDVYIESEYPEAVEIQQGAQISMRSTIIAHTRGPGRVIVKRDAYVGPGCLITAPANREVTIGEGAVLMAGSIVGSSIPSYTLFGGEKGKAMARVTRPLPLCTEYMEFVRGLRPLRSGPKDGRHD